MKKYLDWLKANKGEIAAAAAAAGALVHAIWPQAQQATGEATGSILLVLSVLTLAVNSFQRGDKGPEPRDEHGRFVKRNKE